jgi:hypothetical protein
MSKISDPHASQAVQEDHRYSRLPVSGHLLTHEAVARALAASALSPSTIASSAERRGGCRDERWTRRERTATGVTPNCRERVCRRRSCPGGRRSTRSRARIGRGRG